MRVGIVLSNTPAYSETFFISKIKGLQEQGLSVRLFVQKKSGDFNLCPVSIAPKVHSFAPLQVLKMMFVFCTLVPYAGRVISFITLERNENTSWGALSKKIFLNAHMLRSGVDWLHFGFATQALGSECVARAIKANMAVSFRGFDINVYPVKNPGCYLKVWKYVDKVHSISEYLRDSAVGMGLSEDTPYQIITPAVASDALPMPKSAHTDVTQIVTIARLNWIKGIDVALKAMALLKQEDFSFVYHIIGDGSVKEKERYAFEVYESSLSEDVVFHGKMSHAKTLSLLQEATVYVQPSINEGFCNAVLEAQAMGALVIASDVGGLPENIIDGETGWLFPVQDAAALAKKIKQVVALSDVEKHRISEKARTRVFEDFSIEKQQQEFVSFYTESL